MIVGQKIWPKTIQRTHPRTHHQFRQKAVCRAGIPEDHHCGYLKAGGTLRGSLQTTMWNLKAGGTLRGGVIRLFPGQRRPAADNSRPVGIRAGAGPGRAVVRRKGAVNKLRKYLWWYMRRVEQSPLDAKIVYLFLKTNANFLNTEVYSNVKNFYAYLVEIFEEGRKSGEMKADLNPRAARDIFVGTMDHIISRWLLKDMSYSLFDESGKYF